VYWNPKGAYNIFPYKMMNFVRGYLRNHPSFNPFGKVLDGNDEVLHLTYGQREMAQNVYTPGMERPWAIN